MTRNFPVPIFLTAAASFWRLEYVPTHTQSHPPTDSCGRSIPPQEREDYLER